MEFFSKHWGDLASVVGLALTLLAIWFAWRAKAAAEGSTYDQAKARRKVLDDQFRNNTDPPLTEDEAHNAVRNADLRKPVETGEPNPTTYYQVRHGPEAGSVASDGPGGHGSTPIPGRQGPG